MLASRFLFRKGTDFGFHLTGVALASGSVLFAVEMYSRSDGELQIPGAEHLAIYAKPTTVAPSENPRHFGANIDYTPIGSTAGSLHNPVLNSYEIVEATRDSAVIRLPEGRIIKIAPGVRVAGLGGVIAIEQRAHKWVVITQSGVIRAR
jgi:hypothetical protein